MGLRESLLVRRPVGTIDLTTEGYGVCTIIAFTGEDRVKWAKYLESLQERPKVEQLRGFSYTVVLGLGNPDGTPAFEEGDLERVFSRMDQQLVERLALEILKANGLSSEAAEEQKKTSSDTATIGSGSSSP